ncbi:MAG: hypothetical protein F6K09_14610, partial [Merismopedia sp. SIO2A8]|nr:hypothetical protein [Merismopedia sp. SIO2A8]
YPGYLRLDCQDTNNQGSNNQTFELSAIDAVNATIDLETIAMKTLIRQKGVHGAIAVFTPQINSEALHSEALNLALESQLPVISPLNTESIIVSEGRSERFRQDREKTSPRKKLDYWARTITSDRQHLSAIAQLTHQKNWQRIATIAPDTPRGRHLEQLFTDALTPFGGTIVQPDTPIRYSLISSSGSSELGYGQGLNSTDSSTPPPQLTASAPQLLLSADLASLSAQPPDAILLILSSTHQLESLQRLMVRLSETAELNQTPVIIDRWVDVDELLQQSHITPWLTVESSADIDLQKPRVDLQDSQAQAAVIEKPDSPTSPSLQDESHGFKGIWGVAPKHQLPRWKESRPATTPLGTPTFLASSYVWDAAALMMLAAEAAGRNSKYGIQAELRNVANPPGIEVTDICQGLEYIRQGESINYQGISGQVDLGGWGDVNRVQHYGVWRIDETGDRQSIEPLQWSTP